MKKIKTSFKDLFIIQSKNNFDSRGHLREIFNEKILNKKFVFDYYSYSKKNTIRGLHLQTKKGQDKLIVVIKGKILDICLDLRKNSNTYLKSFMKIISAKDGTSLFVPKGFAHGFLTLSNENIVLYKNTNFHNKKYEISIDIFDNELDLKLPKKTKFIISKKDKFAMSLEKFKEKYLNEK